MSEAMNLIKEIRDNLSQRSSSQKDEVKVMQCILNDKEYIVDIYASTGKIGEYNPSLDARKLISSAVSSTTKISKDEADHLANEHEFSKQEATSFVNVSKEFINTYMETGRKLPLGGRAESNVSLIGKDVLESVSRYPKKITNSDGSVSYQNAEKKVAAHKTIKSSGPCPTWVD